MSSTPDWAARIAVDAGSAAPPWRQVRDQILELVEAGQLPVGARLPAIRQLATDLRIAPGTVARAYKELEAEGILATARRHGTVVAATPGRQADPLRDAARVYVERARALGVDARAALTMVQRVFDQTD